MASEPQTVEGVSSRTDSNDSPQTVEVDGEVYEYSAEKPWRDADLLEKLYWENKMSQHKIGAVFGCDQKTVSRWMRKLDVEARKPKHKKPVRFTHHHDGYETWRHQHTGCRVTVRVHRLLAVAEYGFNAVCGNHVHHQNHIPWDNRPNNIEVKSREQHQRDHVDERFGHDETLWRDEKRLRELYVEKQMSQCEIADEWGCSQDTISKWLDRHGIESRSQSEAQKARYADDNQQTLTEAE